MAGNLTTPPQEELASGAPAAVAPPAPVPGGITASPPTAEIPSKANERKAPAPPKEPKEEKEGKTGALILVRPDEAAWECGRIKRNAGLFNALEASEGPAAEEKKLGGTSGVIVGIPVRQLMGLPLWLATDDTSLIPEMVQLQLEKRGLAAAALPGTRLQIRTVVRETGRTLVLALLLSEPVPEEMLVTWARAYEPSPMTYPVSENSLAFWKEQGQVVMAYRRGPLLAYLHAFTHAEAGPALAAELTCVLLPLMQDNVITDLKKVAVWGSFTPTEISLLSQTLEFPVQHSPRPGFILPQEASPLLPDSVLYRRDEARRAARMKNIGMIVGACYLLFLAFVLGQYFWVRFQVAQLRDSLAGVEPTVQRIENTLNTWQGMEPAIDPSFSAAELLLQTSLPLPEKGVRWTNFALEPGAINIRGEAQSFREAQAYYQELTKRSTLSPTLAPYDWELGDQKVLASGQATFRISGKNRYYASDNP